MIKHIEIKTIEKDGVKVSVKINYDKSEISLVEKNGYGAMSDWKDKHYIFANRGLGYMSSWISVVDAVKFAIDEASKELSLYVKEKEKENEDEIAEVMGIVTEMIKDKSKPIKNKFWKK